MLPGADHVVPKGALLMFQLIGALYVPKMSDFWS